jgi:hypothetical protein
MTWSRIIWEKFVWKLSKTHFQLCKLWTWLYYQHTDTMK